MLVAGKQDKLTCLICSDISTVQLLLGADKRGRERARQREENQKPGLGRRRVGKQSRRAQINSGLRAATTNAAHPKNKSQSFKMDHCARRWDDPAKHWLDADVDIR